MKSYRFLILTIFVLVSSPTFAQTDQAPPSGNTAFGMNLGLGTEVVDGKVYNTLSLVPDLGFPPVGVGLDVTLRFQMYQESAPDKFGFYIREKDWYDPTKTFAQNLDTYLARIVYLRYGQKGEPLYAKMGMIQDGTLGNGFIMGGYDNSTLRPEKKYVGVAFDLDGKLFGIPYVGFETFVGNITAWDVYGGRLYVRPLAGTELGILKDLQAGFTYVNDTNAFYNADPAKFTDPAQPYIANPKVVRVMGGDLRLPVLSNDFLSLALFGDYAYENGNTGSMAGFGGSVFKFLRYGVQARFLGQNFIPVYFDQGYDLNRTQKYTTYKGTTTTPAYNGWFASLGAGVEKVFLFNVSLEGPLGSVDGAQANDPNIYPKLRGIFRIEDGVLPIGFQAFYNKDLIKDFWTLTDPTNAQIGARISYKTGPAIIALNYQLRYIPENQRAVGGAAWDVTSKIETAVKLY